MPYSSLSVHRKGNAYAAVKGYNKYIWDFETGSSKGENSLGRYLSHGALFVAQTDPDDGFIGAGIDYNGGFHPGYLPGATTKSLPIEKVFFKNFGTKKYIEGYHRSFAETTFAGGLTQEGENGMYSMELRDDVGPDSDKILFDNSFRAKKSYFFIGDEIICLGSNINNDDSRYKTITTLFQYKFDENHVTSYKGKSIGSTLSLDKNISSGYFTDQNGIHYILGDTNDIRLEQNIQKSLKRVGKKYESIEVPHVKAYLDHGIAPRGKGYEYQILLNSSNEVVKQFVDKKSYKVLSKNIQVHSIYHKNSGITAYAIFDNKASLQGPILYTDTPILAMFKKPGAYSVLTIANPDLNLPKWNHNMSLMPEEIVNGNSKGGVVTVSLKGIWYPAKNNNALQNSIHKDGNTVLEVFCKEGKSIDISLQQRN